MTPDLEHLLTKSAPRESLSPTERAHMRAELAAHMDYHRKQAPETAHTWTLAFRALVQGRAPVFLSAFLVIAITTGSVTAAAEGALPGDPLYSVKVDLLEPLRLSLASSEKGRTAWQRSFAERRLTEAAQLAEQGRLTPDTEAELAATFVHYADLVIETPQPAAKVAAEPEADAGADAGSARMMTMSLSVEAPAPETDPETEDFSARLSAYESILMHIDKTRKSTTTEALRRAIHAQTEKVPEAADDDARARQASLKAAARLEVYTEVTETLQTDLPTDLEISETATSTTPTSETEPTAPQPAE